MSYVEVETGRYVKRWAFWNPATWSIPKLYWDAWSQEQRIHAICRQLEKVIKYADYLGVNVDDIAARLKAIEDGQLNDFIVAAIETWFEENKPEIVTAIENLQNSVDLINENGWVTNQRIADNAVTTSKIADNAVTNDKIADNAVSTTEIADNAVSTAKIADEAVTESKISQAYKDKVTNSLNNRRFTIQANRTELVWIGDSYSVGYQDSTGSNLPETQRMNYYVAQNLGMTLHDYSKGGAGFSEAYGTATDTLLDLAEDAAADTTFDHANVGLVVILGGRNDYSTLVDGTVSNAVTSTVNTLKTAFPNARIFYAFNYDWGRTGNKNELRMWHNMRIIYRALQYITNPSVIVAKNSWTWFLGQKELFDNGGLHPNALGHQAYAQMITQSIIGGSSATDDYIFTEGALGSNLNAQGACCYAVRTGALLHVHLHANIKTVPNANFTAATLFNLGCWGATNDFTYSRPAYLNLRHCRVMPVFSNGNLNLVIGLVTGGATWSDFVVGNTLDIDVTIPFIQEGPNLLT